LRKLDDIVARRRAWCRELHTLLESIPGIHCPYPTPGCEPSWWFYLLRVDSQTLGVTTDEFTSALQAEEVRCSAHYIGQPVYRYPLFLDHSAFERPGHPYEVRDYSRECCPTAEAILESGVMLPVNEAFTSRDAQEIAFAIRRLAQWFIKRKQ
jgi:dTDP-4-amino-4,6-dideoxygalactose transaminase